jgi:hypothetical protein
MAQTRPSAPEPPPLAALSDEDQRLAATPAYQMLVAVARAVLAATLLLSLLIGLFLLGLPQPIFIVLALPCFVVAFGGGLAGFVLMVAVGVSDLAQRRFRVASQRERLAFLVMFAGDIARPLRSRLRRR